MERKEAIEIVRKLYNESLFMKKDKEAMVTLIPELKESENERIRREMIEIIKNEAHEFPSSVIANKSNSWIAWLEKQGELQAKAGVEWGNTIDDACDKRYSEEYAHGEYCHEQSFKWGFQEGVEWLEKQGEQKLVDKVKPKFKVGDWIINNDKRIAFPEQILKIEKYGYVTSGGYISFDKVKTDYHFWTIQDAKDGDVLCCENGWTCIFKALNSDISFSSYCFMDSTEWFCETGSESHTLEKAFIKAYNGNIYPATKEQRDLLFQKMKEAGYEWDAEKKELKKIE